jgi:hypothetical protein
MSERERAEQLEEAVEFLTRHGALDQARAVSDLSERVDALTFGVSKEHEAGVKERARAVAAEERIAILEAALEAIWDYDMTSPGPPIVQIQEIARVVLQDSQTEGKT